MPIITVQGWNLFQLSTQRMLSCCFSHVTKARWISSDDSQRDLLPNCKSKLTCHEFHYYLSHATGTAYGVERLLPGIITLNTKCLQNFTG